MTFVYRGDDKCPKCGVWYCADASSWPQEPTDTVRCLNCKHEGPVQEFMDAFESNLVRLL
jgi:predicted Zn finger-like uncharacterized protein